jgi:hypothetical protein
MVVGTKDGGGTVVEFFCDRTPAFSTSHSVLAAPGDELSDEIYWICR